MLLTPAMLQDFLPGLFPEAVKATIPALAVYLLTQRSISKHKEQTTVARDEAKKEIAEALGPALQLFRAEFTDELLKRMNGTYLRSEEARIHFTNLTDSIRRLETEHTGLSQTINNLATTLGRRKID
jgi:hypothetical protein